MTSALALERRSRIGRQKSKYSIDDRPAYSEYSLIPTCKQTLIQTTENTMEKETVIIGDKQAPATQKQKATDHIDEELRLAIFKTLKLSQICIFFHFVRISERGSKRHRKKSQSQLRLFTVPYFSVRS